MSDISPDGRLQSDELHDRLSPAVLRGIACMRDASVHGDSSLWQGQILYSARGRALAGSARERSDMGCGPLTLGLSVFVLFRYFERYSFPLVHWFGGFFWFFVFYTISNLNKFKI
jgi:hypothetical protein